MKGLKCNELKEKLNYNHPGGPPGSGAKLWQFRETAKVQHQAWYSSHCIGSTEKCRTISIGSPGYIVVRIAHIEQVTMWPTYWKPFQGATKLDLVSQTECEMAISQKSQLSHFPLPQEYLWGTYGIGKKFIFIPVSELDQENFRGMG